MATSSQVKQYLAYWFQLGKKAIVQNGQQSLLPQPVVRGDAYSREFEDCWHFILSPESGDCYLEGTPQTIKQLLSPEWEIGVQPAGCPCSDLPSWPNRELPIPRSPINTQKYLNEICRRLLDDEQ
jgi:hypothetical protein